MEWIYVSTKAIHQGSVELALLMKKGEISIFIYHRLIQYIICKGIYTYTGRESHVDSESEAL